MVKIIIDGIQHSGKEVVVKDWNSHAHEGFVHTFADDYEKADEMIKKQK